MIWIRATTKKIVLRLNNVLWPVDTTKKPKQKKQQGENNAENSSNKK
jgi:hypothetical protein